MTEQPQQQGPLAQPQAPVLCPPLKYEVAQEITKIIKAGRDWREDILSRKASVASHSKYKQETKERKNLVLDEARGYIYQALQARVMLLDMNGAVRWANGQPPPIVDLAPPSAPEDKPPSNKRPRLEDVISSATAGSSMNVDSLAPASPGPSSTQRSAQASAQQAWQGPTQTATQTPALASTQYRPAQASTSVSEQQQTSPDTSTSSAKSSKLLTEFPSQLFEDDEDYDTSQIESVIDSLAVDAPEPLASVQRALEQEYLRSGAKQTTLTSLRNKYVELLRHAVSLETQCSSLATQIAQATQRERFLTDNVRSLISNNSAVQTALNTKEGLIQNQYTRLVHQMGLLAEERNRSTTLQNQVNNYAATLNARAAQFERLQVDSEALARDKIELERRLNLLTAAVAGTVVDPVVRQDDQHHQAREEDSSNQFADAGASSETEKQDEEEIDAAGKGMQEQQY